MGFHSGQDLLELTSATQAADYLTDLVAPKSDDQIDQDKGSSSSSSSESDSSSSSEENEEKLQSITISVL